MATASLEDVQETASRLRFAIPEGHEEDYRQLLASTARCIDEINNIPDYFPVPDLQRWPREHVHLPPSEENTLKGWAWKAQIKGTPGGPLTGRTVCFKDTIGIAGVPLLFGTDAFSGYIPSSDATCVTRVLEAGGLLVGKAACENFSHGGASFTSPYGPVENPYAIGFSAGGSSSGCGALIGSGEVDMGIGGDQGGSIRIPAALCGLVGLKPTFGLVPYTGVLSSEAVSDHVGPMARTALDCALLLSAIAGDDGIDDRGAGAPSPSQVSDYAQLLIESRKTDPSKFRIAVLKEGFAHPAMASSVSAKVQETVERLRTLGIVCSECSIPLHTSVDTMCHLINKMGSSQTRAGRQVGRRGLYLNEYWDQLLPWNQEKFDKARYYVTGTAMSGEFAWNKQPTAYGKAVNLSRLLANQYDELLEDYDAILMPTVLQPARRHVESDAGPLAWASIAAGITSNTAASNLTGHPSLTFPCGFTSPLDTDCHSSEDKQLKLPCGVQLVGRKYDEATLLQIADVFEQNVDWKTC